MHNRAGRLVLLFAAGAGGSTLASASKGGGLGEALITPQIGTFFWTVVTFVFMLVILGRYAWRPLLGAIEAREKSIQDTLDQARRERVEAQSLLKQQQELLTQARRERAEALAQGQRDAEQVKAEILEAARQQRERVLRQAEEQIQAAVRQARTELRGVATDLAIRAAEKLLQRNMDDATQRKVVEDYLADLERSAAAKRSDVPS